MSDSFALRRLDTPRTWAWLALGLILMATMLVLFLLPRRGSADQNGERGPTVRPQSNTRPMPPPSVARTRSLAA